MKLKNATSPTSITTDAAYRIVEKVYTDKYRPTINVEALAEDLNLALVYMRARMGTEQDKASQAAAALREKAAEFAECLLVAEGDQRLLHRLSGALAPYDVGLLARLVARLAQDLAPSTKPVTTSDNDYPVIDTNEARCLAGLILPSVFRAYFPKYRGGIVRRVTIDEEGNEKSGPAGGPYSVFALAVLDELKITMKNGTTYNTAEWVRDARAHFKLERDSWEKENGENNV